MIRASLELNNSRSGAALCLPKRNPRDKPAGDVGEWEKLVCLEKPDSFSIASHRKPGEPACRPTPRGGIGCGWNERPPPNIDSKNPTVRGCCAATRRPPPDPDATSSFLRSACGSTMPRSLLIAAI